MTGWLTIGLPTVAYVVIALVSARVAYGRARIWQYTRRRDTYSFSWGNEAICAWIGAGLTVACLTGLWPVVLAVMFVMAKPPKTPAELREQAERQRQRIAELERELGVGGKS